MTEAAIKRLRDSLEERDLLEPLQQFCRAQSVTVSDVLGPSRERPILAARHAFMRWMISEVGWSASAVGRLLQRDHTGVLNAVRKKKRKAVAA